MKLLKIISEIKNVSPRKMVRVEFLFDINGKKYYQPIEFNKFKIRGSLLPEDKMFIFVFERDGYNGGFPGCEAFRHFLDERSIKYKWYSYDINDQQLFIGAEYFQIVK